MAIPVRFWSSATDDRPCARHGRGLGTAIALRRREWAVLDRLTAKAGEVVSKERLIAEVFQLR